MKTTDVIALVIYKDGKILVEQRKSSKKDDPGKIIIPGGHVEKGESLEEACERELKEELGVDCQTFKFVVKMPHQTKDEDQLIYFFSCEHWKGELQSLDAEKIFWITPEELHIIDYEMDREAIRQFLQLMRRATPDNSV